MPKKPKKRAYDPLAPSFRYQKGFKKAVRKRAQAQVDPLLQDVAQRQREATSAHDTRTSDINSMYGAETAARGAGQTRLQEALTGLMGSMGSTGTDVQNAMSAALAQTGAREGEQAQKLGVQAPSVDPAYLAALAAGTSGNKMGLGGNMAAALTRGAADIGISGVGQREALSNEGRRSQGILDALTNERTDIRSRIPALREEARTAIGNEELQKNISGRQATLAEEQFGETKRSNRFTERQTRRQQQLAREQFGETKKQNKHARKIEGQRLQLDRDTLDVTRQEIKQKIKDSTDTATTDALKDQAARFDKAVEWLGGFLSPGDMDKVLSDPADPSSKTVVDKNYLKSRSFDEAFEQLKAKFGLGPLTALAVLRSAPIPRWRERSNALAKRIKNNRRMRKQGLSGPPAPVNVGDQK